MFGANARSCTGSVNVEKVSTNCHRRAISEYSYTFTFPPPVPELSSEPTAIIGLCSLDKEGFQEMHEQGSFTCISSLGLHWDKFMTS